MSIIVTPVADRRQPLLKKEPASKSRFGEMAGSRAAECAAVCCCCPCTVLSLVVLVVVKFPATLCRKVIKKKKKAPLLLLQRENNVAFAQAQQAPLEPVPLEPAGDFPDSSKEPETLPLSPLDDQMWINSSTGFWRNPSVKE